MMKKSIFAVAVASALTFGAAQAETVLYGSIRYDYENKKIETPYNYVDGQGYGRIGFSGERLSNLEDAGSRIGIKGSEDLGNGNAVIYNIEYGFDGMSANGKGFKTRKALLGLTGDWGTFAAGRQDNPFKVMLVDDHVVDGFNGSNVITSASQRAMTTVLTGQQASGYYTYYDANGNAVIANPGATTEYVAYGWHENFVQNKAAASRVGKVIAYITPDLAGFQASAALMMDEDLYPTNNQKSIDLWTINAQYAYDLGANGTILAKAGYINAKLTDDNASKMWGLFLGYSQDAFNVTASYAKGDHRSDSITLAPMNIASGAGYYTSFGKSKSQGWDLGASFSFGPNYFSTIRANYGESELKNLGNKDKVKSWAVGFEQKLSTRTRAWVEYGNEETSFSAAHVDKRKNSVLSIGMRHDF
ncbi:MAG TPA: porin [Candidatus Ignatzschineria merdigallinarum]|uniref:Porin n=1 Tax=Candidatus Ignatzschineria merdigallinarum TaxID=2838621 RepID=A0A9D1Q842_9GAMM|nr:porin [Candidatus Ignatzschineria merdigallinarum]